MTVALGSWYMYLMYGAIAAIVLVILLVVAFRKKGDYEQEVKGKIKAVVKRETGWPLKKVVKPMIDGWVRIDRGDYKLPDDSQQKETFDKLSDVEKHLFAGDRMTIPSAMEWDFYPDNPFLGLKSLRVPIRVQEWYENDPRPVTWLRDREPEVTTAEAQAHTRQLDAMIAGVRAQELESKSRQMMEAFQRIADKNLVYILLVANIIIGIVIAIKVMGVKVPLP